MTAQPSSGVAASVRQRLLNRAREQKEAFDLVLIRFALERLLYRLSQSEYADRFVLKGAMLFQIWSGEVHRPTRDLDLLGTGSSAPEDFQEIFRHICEVDVADDGLVFLPESVKAAQIKEEEQYEGLRVKLNARLVTARIPVQVDVGFGDAITPGADELHYPALLEFPSATLQTYPRETVVAEKFQAMVMLGIANSRMKDFFDIWMLAKTFPFSGESLSAAIAATFERRKTTLPMAPPLALTTEFSEDRQKASQWKAFLRKSGLSVSDATFADVSQVLSEFLMPPTQAAAYNADFSLTWSAADGWHHA